MSTNRLSFGSPVKSSQMESDRAWVSKIPTLAYADEPGVREWEILLTNPSIKLGEITD